MQYFEFLRSFEFLKLHETDKQRNKKKPKEQKGQNLLDTIFWNPNILDLDREKTIKTTTTKNTRAIS